MKNILSFIVAAVFMTGCGPVKTSSGVSTGGDGPTLVTNQPKDNQAPAVPVKKKRSKKPIKAPLPQEPIAQDPGGQIPTEPVSKPQPGVAVAQAQAPVIVPPKSNEPTVIAMGSTGKKASDFMDQGYDSAILNARFCSATGQFPGGFPCYLVYSNGKTEWANPSNRPAAETFIVQLKEAKDAQQKAKNEKKPQRRERTKE